MRFLTDGFALATVPVLNKNESTKQDRPFSLKDLVGDGFLWAVPRCRRTIEKRLTRKFGHPQGVLKIFLPKTTLRTCNVCGDDHEVGVLCRKTIALFRSTIFNEIKLCSFMLQESD